MDLYPGAVKAEDSDGILPLSMELQQEAKLDVKHFLTKKYPKAVAIATSTGSLPIHFAVSNDKVTTDVLKFLKDVYPKGLTAVLPNGNTLLHHALDARLISEVAVMWIMKQWCVSYAFPLLL